MSTAKLGHGTGRSKEQKMKRNLGIVCLLAVAGLAACGGDTTANYNSSKSTNANVASNVGILVNDNGNKNTAGVRAINSNSNVNQNGSMKTGNSNK